jgi:hypothetical protein
MRMNKPVLPLREQTTTKEKDETITTGTDYLCGSGVSTTC